jgi:ferredoxin
MATLSDRLPDNVSGKFYVDSSCIDCDQCRAQAPDLFGRNDDTGTSFVKQQPQNDEELALMQEALGTCATSSIGDDGE